MTFVLFNKEKWKRELVLVGVLLLSCYFMWYLVERYEKSVQLFDELGEAFILTNKAKRCERFFVEENNIYCEMVDGTIFGGQLKPTYHVFNTYVNAMAAISLADEQRREGKLSQAHFNAFLKYVLETVYNEPENANLITKPKLQATERKYFYMGPTS